ncbi:uncharacterized protein LOC111895202 [Lactuca sativa]|uniref:uncharacterized protein LOC111895202 n=1 Tax=Lactuca sativa TaxID=4236 RepID=UPI000CD994C8|nr:uncharacterized protein LOC111895202 [Lactuca sativa]
MPPRKRPRPSGSTAPPLPTPPPQFDPTMFQAAVTAAVAAAMSQIGTNEKGIEPKVKPCGIYCKTGHPIDICPLLQEDVESVQDLGGFQQRPFDQHRNNQGWGGPQNNNFLPKPRKNVQQRNQYQAPPGFQQPFQQNQHQGNFQQPPVQSQASSSSMSLEDIVKSFATRPDHQEDEEEKIVVEQESEATEEVQKKDRTVEAEVKILLVHFPED